MKNSVTEIKSTHEGIHSKLKEAEGQTINLDEWVMEQTTYKA